ncbi:MAG: hypothetical protein ABW321_01405 [Polyangiales bacterium]
MNTPNELSGHSHPNAVVRHSYPLAITDHDFSTALSLVMRTLPYALARFGVLLATSVATALWWIIALGGASWLGASVHGIAGVLWFVGWVFAFGWAWRSLVRYFLYLLKAGHIVVLTDLITRGVIGDDHGGHEHMFAYGKRVVGERFGQVNALLGLELMIGATVSAFHRSLHWITSLLPVPGMRDITGLVNQVVRAATTYIDETMLSYSLARGDEDLFRVTRDGLLYYAQNSREVLKTGLWIVVLDKLTTVVAWLVMFIPAVAIGGLFPASVRGIAILVTAGLSFMFTWALRSAFLEPLCLTMVMIKFHICVHEQPINLEWDERLSSISSQFVALKGKMAAPGMSRNPGLAAG